MTEERDETAVDDSTVGDLFSPLSSIKAPEELRRAICSAMRKASGEHETPKSPPTLPWWKRKVAIPVPALALAMVLLVALCLHAWVQPADLRTNEEPQSQSQPRDTSRFFYPRNSRNVTESELVPYEQHFCVAGFGPLEIETGNKFE
jgi:hypothetical protein